MHESKGKSMQIRIVQGKEPEHFLKIFGDFITILKGGNPSGFKSTRELERKYEEHRTSLTKLFQIRDKKALQIEPKATSLNSNDIFILIQAPKYCYQWNGLGANRLEYNTAEMFKEQMKLDDVELIRENEEPEEFWELLGGKDVYATGPYLQDLDSDDVMILDAFKEIYVWLGSNSNISERQKSLDIVQKYLMTDPTGRSQEDTILLVVKQGFEPPAFCAHFAGWDEHFWNNRLSYEQLRDQIKMHVTQTKTIETVQEAQEIFSKTYPFEKLLVARELLPYGVDPVNKENHLTDEDFKQVFRIRKDEYQKLARWKQLELKKKVGLF